MENVKKTEKIIQCDECKKTFPMDASIFKTSKNANENGETMDVTYFTCPHCDKVYIVIILDKEAKRRKKRYDSAVKIMNNYAKLRKELPESVRKQFEQTHNDYKSYVNFLKEKYGKFFTLKKE